MSDAHREWDEAQKEINEAEEGLEELKEEEALLKIFIKAEKKLKGLQVLSKSENHGHFWRLGFKFAINIVS